VVNKGIGDEMGRFERLEKEVVDLYQFCFEDKTLMDMESIQRHRRSVLGALKIVLGMIDRIKEEGE
jgi:hypothetical protein